MHFRSERSTFAAKMSVTSSDLDSHGRPRFLVPREVHRAGHARADALGRARDVPVLPAEALAVDDLRSDRLPCDSAHDHVVLIDNLYFFKVGRKILPTSG